MVAISIPLEDTGAHLFAYRVRASGAALAIADITRAPEEMSWDPRVQALHAPVHRSRLVAVLELMAAGEYLVEGVQIYSRDWRPDLTHFGPRPCMRAMAFTQPILLARVWLDARDLRASRRNGSAPTHGWVAKRGAAFTPIFTRVQDCSTWNPAEPSAPDAASVADASSSRGGGGGGGGGSGGGGGGGAKHEATGGVAHGHEGLAQLSSHKPTNFAELKQKLDPYLSALAPLHALTDARRVPEAYAWSSFKGAVTKPMSTRAAGGSGGAASFSEAGLCFVGASHAWWLQHFYLRRARHIPVQWPNETFAVDAAQCSRYVLAFGQYPFGWPNVERMYARRHPSSHPSTAAAHEPAHVPRTPRPAPPPAHVPTPRPAPPQPHIDEVRSSHRTPHSMFPPAAPMAAPLIAQPTGEARDNAQDNAQPSHPSPGHSGSEGAIRHRGHGHGASVDPFVDELRDAIYERVLWLRAEWLASVERSSNASAMLSARGGAAYQNISDKRVPSGRQLWTTTPPQPSTQLSKRHAPSQAPAIWLLEAAYNPVNCRGPSQVRAYCVAPCLSCLGGVIK